MDFNEALQKYFNCPYDENFDGPIEEQVCIAWNKACGLVSHEDPGEGTLSPAKVAAFFDPSGPTMTAIRATAQDCLDLEQAELAAFEAEKKEAIAMYKEWVTKLAPPHDAVTYNNAWNKHCLDRHYSDELDTELECIWRSKCTERNSLGKPVMPAAAAGVFFDPDGPVMKRLLAEWEEKHTRSEKMIEQLAKRPHN